MGIDREKLLAGLRETEALGRAGKRREKLRENIREWILWDVLDALRETASDEDRELIDALRAAWDASRGE